MGFYERLGVRRVINAAGPLTRLGGNRLAPEVLAAMAEAAESNVRLEELQERAGAIIAELTGAEAAYVVDGAAAGLTLAAAACVAGLGPGGDGPAPRHHRAARRDRRPARSPQRLRSCPARRRRPVRRSRLPGLPRRRRHLRLAGGGRHRRADGRAGLSGHGHARHALAARDGGDRPPARPAGDRRRLGRPAAPLQPSSLHRRGRRPRRLLRRQGDRRPAGQRHPGRPARPDRVGRPAAPGPGRPRRDLDPAIAPCRRASCAASPTTGSAAR